MVNSQKPTYTSFLTPSSLDGITPDQAYLIHPAAPPLGSLTLAEAPLIGRGKSVQKNGTTSVFGTVRLTDEVDGFFYSIKWASFFP
jgi:hypothetical protein